MRSEKCWTITPAGAHTFVNLLSDRSSLIVLAFHERMVRWSWCFLWLSYFLLPLRISYDDVVALFILFPVQACGPLSSCPMRRMRGSLVNTYSMPLPISKLLEVLGNVADLHYMSFEEAVLLSISNEHQPLLQIRRKVSNLIVGDVTLGDREPR